MSAERAIEMTIESLPAFPETVSETLRLLGDENAGVTDISSMIAKDPVLTGKLLGLANSACYGFRQKIKNVETALVVLGGKTTKQLLLSIAAISVFKDDGEKHFFSRLLRHSTRVASFAAALRLSLEGKLTGDEFTAGLLHNLGHAVLRRHAQTAYLELLHTYGEGFAVDLAQESARFSLDHCQAGRLLSAHWGLPFEFAACMADHHRPLEQDDALSLPGLIRLALRLDAAERTHNAEESPFRSLPHQHFATELDADLFVKARNDMTRDAELIESLLLG